MIPYSNANNLPIYRLVCSTLTELGSIDETKIDSSISFWFNIYLHHHWTVIKPIAFHCFRTNWRLCELWPSGNECENDNIAKVYWHLIDPPSTLDLIGHDCFQIWFSDTQKGLNSTQIFYYKLRQNYCLDLTNHSNELTPTLVSTPGSRMFVDPKPTDCRFPTYNLSTIIGSNQSEDINYDTPKDP